MSTNVDKQKCLLLNADYAPIKIISWKQAMVLDYKNKSKNHSIIDILEYYENMYVAGTDEKKYSVPAIMRIKKYINIYKHKINFSRKNLFIRDKFSCQYCGKQLIGTQLTYDHVIPKSRYKPFYKKSTSWSNIVTSCRKCNIKKGNKTPDEAGMKLINKPLRPFYSVEYLPMYLEVVSISEDSTYHCWKPYIKHIINNE